MGELPYPILYRSEEAMVNAQLAELENQSLSIQSQHDHLKKYLDLIDICGLTKDQKVWLSTHARVSRGSNGKLAIYFRYAVSKEEYESGDIFGSKQQNLICSWVKGSARCGVFSDMSDYSGDLLTDYGIEPRHGDHHWGVWAECIGGVVIIYSHAPD